MTVPPTVRTPDSNFEQLEDFPHPPRYVEINGLRMHYVDVGPADGPLLLMVHGMPTWAYLYRDVIATMAAAGWRCIAVDHIGFGRSDKVTDESWYSIARHTANLTRFIEALDLRDVTLMVQDWGGPTGLAQYATMPERFVRLVIMNTWLHHDGYEYSPGIQQWISQWVPGGLFEASIPDTFTLGGLMAMATDRIAPQDSIFVAISGGTPEYTGAAGVVQRAYDAPFAGLGKPGVAGPRRFPMSIPHHDPVAGNAAAQAQHFAIVNATTLPVHFIWGEADTVFTEAWGRAWAAMIPHATYDGFADARHFLQDTHGTRIATTLLDRIG